MSIDDALLVCLQSKNIDFFFMRRARHREICWKGFSGGTSAVFGNILIKFNQVKIETHPEHIAHTENSDPSLNFTVELLSIIIFLFYHLINTIFSRAHTIEHGKGKSRQSGRRNVKKRPANCLYNQKIYTRAREKKKKRLANVSWSILWGGLISFMHSAKKTVLWFMHTCNSCKQKLIRKLFNTFSPARLEFSVMLKKFSNSKGVEIKFRFFTSFHCFSLTFGLLSIVLRVS